MFLINFTVSTELRCILLDNMPADDIIKLFSRCKLLSDDDLQVISFPDSEFLKEQLMLRYLQHLKLSEWAVICDMLNNTKSTRSVGSQLTDGK